MINNIIQTNSGYRATIDGIEWTIPDDPGNRHWQMVRDAIAEGAAVAIEQPAPPPPREEWRLTARADRRSLVLAMAKAGILDRPNAAAAARGEWPPAFASALAGLPDDLQLAAEVDWAALTIYSRANPVWGLLGSELNISPDAIDELFGWQDA